MQEKLIDEYVISIMEKKIGKNILDNSVLMILFADKHIKVIYEDRIVLKFTLI